MSEAVGASRIAYHKDGTAVFSKWDGRGAYEEPGLSYRLPDRYELSPLGVEAMNSLYRGGYGTLPEFTVVFPIPMDLRGVLALTNGSPQAFMSYSLDSLTGEDGTWSAETELPQFTVPTASHTSINPRVTIRTRPEGSVIPYMQTETYQTPPGTEQLPDFGKLFSKTYTSPTDGGINPLSLNNVRALRFRKDDFPRFHTGGTTQLFLWGGPSAGEYSDYVQVQDIDRSLPLAHEADFGKFPPHSSFDRRVRVRNMSWDRTATDIVVTASPDADQIPSPYRGLILLSLDGERWEEKLMLYSLSPSSASPTIYVRLVAGGEFPTGREQALLTASVKKWV